MWELIYEEAVIEDVTVVNGDFTSTAIAVLATAFNPCDNYYRAGYLSRFINDSLLGVVQVENSVLIPLNKFIVFNFKPLVVPYQLRFEMVDWLGTMNLELYQATEPFFDQPDSNTNGNTQQLSSQEQIITAYTTGIL